MGIKGLLPTLREITVDVNINCYKGKKVGVDAYVWLHQKAFGCATEICLQQPTNFYVAGFMKEVRTLLHNGVIPVIVFDGTYLPLKARVEEERAKTRKLNLKQGKKLYRQGRKEEAFQRFTKAVNITPQMAYEVILKLKELNVEYYVAPYEADAQLAYLYKIGHIFAVISVDSDLLPFGCTRLLTKYSRGWCKEINLGQLTQNINPLNFSKFSFEMFMQFCIFCGCDYVDKIPGIGPKTAHQYMLRGKRWQRVINTIRFDGKYRIPKEYEDTFQKALYTFRHQRVYDPTHKRLVHLQPLPPDQPNIATNTDFLGPDMDPNVAQQIAEGIIDPISKAVLESQHGSLRLHVSLLSKSLTPPRHSKRRKSKPKQTNTMLSYLNNNNNNNTNNTSSIISLNDGNTDNNNNTNTESIDGPTQCASPPPPAVLFEKSFERHKQSIQIISDNLDKIQQLQQKQNTHAIFTVNDPNIETLKKKRKKKKNTNNVQRIESDEEEEGDDMMNTNNYQRLDSFTFNNDNGDGNNDGGKGDKKRDGHNGKNKIQRNDTIVIDDDDEEEQNVLALSQTQPIDLISDRHKRMVSQRNNNKYHQFKQVMPTKGLPAMKLLQSKNKRNTNNRRRNHNGNNSNDGNDGHTADSLDDRMSQFAFGNDQSNIPRESNNFRTTTNPRKRRRSPSSIQQLLPSKPSQSVDYNKSDNDDSIPSPQYESKPHQFRPPRIKAQFNKNRTKKRRLNTSQDKTRKFESPFIPKQTGSFALYANTSNNNNNTIPQGSFASFAFKPKSKQNHQSIPSNVETVESMASFHSDTSPTNKPYDNDTQITAYSNNNNRHNKTDKIQPYESELSIIEYPPPNQHDNNDEYYDEDDNDDNNDIDDSFLNQYPLQNANDTTESTIACSGYVPETPEPTPDPPQSNNNDINIQHDDIENSIGYIPSSLEINNGGNNIDNLNELDNGPQFDHDDDDDDDLNDIDNTENINDFSVPMDDDPINRDFDRNNNRMHVLDEFVNDGNDGIDGIDMNEDDDLMNDDILGMDNELHINYNHKQSERLVTSSPTSPSLENVNDCIDLTTDDIEDNQQRQRNIQEIDEVILIDDEEMDNNVNFNDNQHQYDNRNINDNFLKHPDQITLLDDDDEDENEEEAMDPIILSDDDKENNAYNANLSDKRSDNESPLNWRRKKPRSTSPDIFDPQQQQQNHIDINGDDILSQHIELQLNHQEIQYNMNSLEDDMNDLQSQILIGVDDVDDDDDNDIDINLDQDDELNIDSMPMDDLLINGVQSTCIPSPKRRGRGRARFRNKLIFQAVQTQCALGENDYF